MEPVQSTAINAMGYDSSTQQLLVEWKSGEVHGYRGVPADTYDYYIKGAESLGEAVNTQIKPRYQSASLGHTDIVARDLPTINPYTVAVDGRPVRMEPVQSDAVNAIGYDRDSRRLLVEYKQGRVYAYDDVDEGTWNYVSSSGSIGRAMQVIREDHGVTELGHARDIGQAVEPEQPATPPAESATDTHLRHFLQTPAEMERNGGLGSAAIAHLANSVRSGQWDWRDGDYPNVAAILADPEHRQHISAKDADTVLRSYRPDWYGDAEGFQQAVTPDAVGRMDPPEATLALGRMFEMAQAGVWRVDSRRTEENWQRLTGLYARANLSQLDPELVRDGYNSILKNSNAAGARDATAIVIGNPTTPPTTLTAAAEEISFDSGYKKTDAMSLATHPNLDAAGAAMLAKSPDAGVRYTAAISKAADADTLNRLLKDSSDRVAKGALLNTAGPHAQTAADNRAAGINDNETLAIVRRKEHSWQDMPRCGQCGAWTKKNGVCANKRCGGVGRVMAAPQDTGQQQSKFAVPNPVRRRLDDNYHTRNAIKSTLETWEQAAAHGQFPAEWKGALPGAISELAATGKWEAPSGSVIRWKDDNYQLDGIPVPSKNAGDAVKTYFALMDQGNQVEVEVKNSLGQPTGEKETRPRWRYSEGYEALVAHDSDEPSDLYLQGGKPLDAGQSPLTPPNLATNWKQWHSTRKITVYDNAGQLLIAHKPGSTNYAWVKEGEDFQVSGKALKQALKVVGTAAAGDSVRPAFQQVWGLPANNGQRDLDAPNGVWAAADGYRLMLVAHEGKPIAGPVNVRPEMGKLIPDDAQVTMGRNGLAWQGKEGHVFEAESDLGGFPDYNRIIPTGEPQFSFRITGDVPVEMIRASDPKIAVLEAERGEVFMTVLTADGDHFGQRKVVGRVKVGESDNKVVAGQLAGINPQYFNDVAKTKLDGGGWTMGVHSATTPLVVKHDSRKAVGAIMPMHLK